MKWKVLAGLRFFLAAIVLCYHLSDFIPNYGSDWLGLLGRLNGVAAVLGFLLISGYSIASSIYKESQGFYQRRFWRIYPLYFCSVLISLIPFLILGDKIQVIGIELQRPDVTTVLGNLLFLQTFLVDSIHSDIVVWTLAVEVWCYLLTPLFFKLSNQVLMLLISGSSIIYVLLPKLYQLFAPQQELPFFSYLNFGFPFYVFLWAWLLGFLYFRIEQKSYAKFLLIGWGCFLLLLNSTHIGKIGIITYVLSGIILVLSPSIKLPRKVLQVFNYLGEISYPLYLFHMPLFIFLFAVLKVSHSVTYVFLALVVSIVFYHGIDKPLRQKKFVKATA